MCGVPSRSTVAVMGAHSCLSGSGIAFVFFPALYVFFTARPH